MTWYMVYFNVGQTPQSYSTMDDCLILQQINVVHLILPRTRRQACHQPANLVTIRATQEEEEEEEVVVVRLIHRRRKRT